MIDRMMSGIFLNSKIDRTIDRIIMYKLHKSGRTTRENREIDVVTFSLSMILFTWNTHHIDNPRPLDLYLLNTLRTFQ